MADQVRAANGWPKTTPSGHVYNAPTTYEELCRRHEDAGQGFAEGWDADELPPEPTWEMVGLAHREIERLRQADDDLHHDLVRVMEQRNGAVTTVRMLMRGMEGLVNQVRQGAVEARHADVCVDLLRIAAEWATSAEMEVME